MTAELIDRLRAKIEAIPPRDRDWYAVTSPWLGKDEETWIISGSPDPHKGLAVCDFQDVSFAGVEDQFTDEEWTGHNWAMAEFIETADPNAVLKLIVAIGAKNKEITALRAVLAECEEYFDDRADADQPAGSDCPTPNEAMRLLTAIRGVK
jgi:hypothetical protein